VADRSTAAVDVAKEGGAPLDGAAAAAATPGATIDAVDKDGTEARSESETGPGGDRIAATEPLPEVTDDATTEDVTSDDVTLRAVTLKAAAALEDTAIEDAPADATTADVTQKLPADVTGTAQPAAPDSPGAGSPDGAPSRAAEPEQPESTGTHDMSDTAEMSQPDDAPPSDETAVLKPTPEAPAPETPASETPVVETPVVEAPVSEAPVSEAPVSEATVSAAPAPKSSAPKPSAPEATAPRAAAPEAKAPGPRTEPAPNAPLPDPPELHSGHKLAARYRLEECLTRAEGFSSWRAVDEMLRRAVGIHVLRSRHPRAKRVLAAARSAALLGDPRFVQVLDAVEEDDLVYVVHEWLPDAVELTAVLAGGPMQPYEADQMVRQLAEAMAAAHREGLAHLKLTPQAVLRTDGGQFRIRGLAVAAALHGCESARPQREDTEAIGALLYAALTHRWPYPEDAHGLTGLPPDIGLVAPDQVRAGVHRGLSELAMRALVNNGATPLRQEPACATPEELARAAAGIPRVRPPEPEISPYQRTAYQPGGYRRPPAHGAMAPAPAPAVPPPPPPALPGRTGKALKWTVSALLIAALGLGSWQIGDALLHKDKSRNNSSSASSGSKTAHAKPVPLPIAGAHEYVTSESAQDPGDVASTYDKNIATYWRTHSFLDGPQIKIKAGVGIMYDLGSKRKVDTVSLSLLHAGPHTTVSLYAAGTFLAAPADRSRPYAGLTKLGTATTQGRSVKITAAGSVRTRYVLVWLTALPQAPGDQYSQAGYKQGITNVMFTGSKR
jgi:serine/threonine protein kinase